MIIAIVLAAACIIFLLRIRTLTKELEHERKLSLTKSAFISNLSREIRTPLLSMRNQTETLSREDIFLSKDEKQTISGQMAYNVNLISTLLDEMMSISGCGEGHEINDVGFSPTLMCLRCITSNQSNTYLTPGVQLRFKREMSDGVFIKSDVHIVELIVNKLLINACKFTKEGEIVVGCNLTDNPECLTIYIQDTGAGIPSNRRDAMFDWFDNPVTTMAGAEVEFDLSVAQHLAMKLGGLLRLDETYQQGTRMTLVLPVK